MFSPNILRFLTHEVSIHCITCMRGSRIFLIGIIEPSFPSFLLSFHLNLHYSSSRKDHPEAMMPHIVFDNLHMGDFSRLVRDILEHDG